MGNKNDCPDRKVVLYEDAKRFADQMGITLFETSAKNNTNVDDVSSNSLYANTITEIDWQLSRDVSNIWSLFHYPGIWLKSKYPAIRPDFDWYPAG